MDMAIHHLGCGWTKFILSQSNGWTEAEFASKWSTTQIVLQRQHLMPIGHPLYHISKLFSLVLYFIILFCL
jgi:hypothetical protein